jgi:hypothetical protein
VRTKERTKVRTVFEAKGGTKMSKLVSIVLEEKVRTRAGRR